MIRHCGLASVYFRAVSNPITFLLMFPGFTLSALLGIGRDRFVTIFLCHGVPLTDRVISIATASTCRHRFQLPYRNVFEDLFQANIATYLVLPLTDRVIS